VATPAADFLKKEQPAGIPSVIGIYYLYAKIVKGDADRDKQI
jgi:hypothetical protein